MDGLLSSGTSAAGVTSVRARLMALIDRGTGRADGRLPPERALAARLGVGRRAVRRALEALEAEGLIWRRQGKGTFLGLAPDPTGALAADIAGETGALDMMEARLCIEPALAAMCARRATPADIERMRNLAQRVMTARDAHSIELWDGGLHRMIARTAGNRPLLTAFALLDEIRASDAWTRLRSRARSAVTMQVTGREHDAVIDAIEAGDPAAAEAAMRTHLTTLAANVRRILPDGPAAGEDPAP